MDFKESRILIAGLGLIGGSAAKSLKKSGFSNIYAYDNDVDTINEAKENAVISNGFTKLSGQIDKFDFVLCCLSPIYVAPLYKSIAPYLKDGGVFAEVGGIKSVLIRELEDSMQPFHELLSLHPMAGSEKKGYRYSSSEMFRDSVLVITPGSKTKQKAFAWADELKESFGCSVLKELSPQKHDEIIAHVSHIPHVVALAVKAMNNGTENELYAGGSYKSATRVSQINSALWAGLMSDNKEYLISSIEELEAHIRRLKETIAIGEYKDIEKLLIEMSGQE